jgi:hypothetical protein
MAVRLSARKIPDRLSRPQGLSASGRIMSVEKSIDLIGNQPRDLPSKKIGVNSKGSFYDSLSGVVVDNVHNHIALKFV